MPGEESDSLILFDISSLSLSHNTTGIQRAVENIGAELEKLFIQGEIRHGFSFVAFHQTGRNGRLLGQISRKKIPGPRGGRRRQPKVIVDLRKSLVKSELAVAAWSVLLRALNRLSASDVASLGKCRPDSSQTLVLADAFWDPRVKSLAFAKRLKRNGGRIVTMIYDIFPITNPAWFSESLVRSFNSKAKWALQNSDLILVNSMKVKSDIACRFPSISESKVRLVPLATGKSSQPMSSRPRNPKSILMIGTLEPRKNYDLVIRWWERFGMSDGWSLTIVGNKGWASDGLADKLRALKSSHFQWLEGVDDASLEELMFTHQIGLSASRDEGYGLPSVEMASRGLKSVLSDIETFRELHEEAVFFDPTDEASLNSALGMALNTDYVDSRKTLVSWCDSAKSLKMCIENLMAQTDARNSKKWQGGA